MHGVIIYFFEQFRYKIIFKRKKILLKKELIWNIFNLA